MSGMYPPERTRFCEYLIEYNGLSDPGFDTWLFYPGMLFNAGERWWGNGGNRDRPHEGLDLCFYRDSRGQTRSLSKDKRIPVMYTGEVVKIEDDFLGVSIYVSHDIYDGRGNRLLTVYGHTRPGNGIISGSSLGEGDLFATVADNAGKRMKAPSHLHISVAWIPPSVSCEELDWGVISDPAVAWLVDPLEIMSCRYEVVGGTR
jgi:hypothetical protein